MFSKFNFLQWRVTEAQCNNGKMWEQGKTIASHKNACS